MCPRSLPLFFSEFSLSFACRRYSFVDFVSEFLKGTSTDLAQVVTAQVEIPPLRLKELYKTDEVKIADQEAEEKKAKADLEYAKRPLCKFGKLVSSEKKPSAFPNSLVCCYCCFSVFAQTRHITKKLVTQRKCMLCCPWKGLVVVVTVNNSEDRSAESSFTLSQETSLSSTDWTIC